MVNKIMKHIKNNKWHYITFFTALICVCIIYAIEKIRPFGNNSMLDVDFYHQYGPLLNELRNRVTENRSLLYSFNTGGGIPFYRNFLNYLSSPFNIIIFLFKSKNIIMAFSIIIGFKAVFAAVSMSYYLKKVFKKEGIFIVIFSITYALSGYFCAYYWNIMWLDGMVFLPIIMYGINKIVDEEKPFLYIIFLSIMLFANYFIGYMICLFAVLYFLGYLLYRSNYEHKKDIKKCVIFAVSSILAAGLVSFALLPLYYSLSSISATNDGLPGSGFNFGFLNYLFNHLSAVKRTVFASDELPLPNVAPGILSLVGMLLFFVNRKINLQSKVIAFATLLFFFMTFNIKLIDFIWHAFHVPNDLPYRYSFIYVFIFNVLGAYGFSRIKENSKLVVSICFSIILIIILVALKLSFVNLTMASALICMIILLSYYLVYFSEDLIKPKTIIINIFLIIICSTEVILSISTNWDINHDIDVFMKDKDNYINIINNITKKDNDLYRYEKTNYLTLNDPAWFDYKGISTFSSMAYENVSKSQKKLGLAGNTINSYYLNGYTTPLYNTLFNIKYFLGNYTSNDLYEAIDSKENIFVMKYKYPTSIGYGVNKSIKNWQQESYKPFYNQERFVELATGLKNIYVPVVVDDFYGFEISNSDELDFTKNNNIPYKNVTNKKLNITLKNEIGKNIYVYVGGADVSGYYVDGSYYSITSDESYIADIGRSDNETVHIEIVLKSNSDMSFDFYAYTINMDVFDEFVDMINESKLNVSSYTDTEIISSINLNEDKTIFTTIAYDDGWQVFVDGKKVNTFKIDNSFLAFDVSKGYHNIKLKFKPKYFEAGVIISFISLIITVSYFVFDKKIKKR